MESRIETLTPKKLAGMHLRMKLADNKTPELWRAFMPRLREIKNATGTDLYSLKIYDTAEANIFSLDTEFERWAAVEVTDFNAIPEGMDALEIPGGLYAVFLHMGPPSEAARTFGYIYREWLPRSGYLLDNRPHFELLGEMYSNTSPDSEEEIWVPVKRK